MLDTVLCARRGQRPTPSGEVDLRPLHGADFLTPSASQDQQLDGRPERIGHAFRRPPNAGKLVVRQDAIASQLLSAGLGDTDAGVTVDIASAEGPSEQLFSNR